MCQFFFLFCLPLFRDILAISIVAISVRNKKQNKKNKTKKKTQGGKQCRSKWHQKVAVGRTLFSLEMYEYITELAAVYIVRKCTWTLSMPNFRRHLSSAFFFFFFFFFFFNELSLRKKFICKVERLNVKQHRSRWDGSLSAVSSKSMLFAKSSYYRLWQWKS